MRNRRPVSRFRVSLPFSPPGGEAEHRLSRRFEHAFASSSWPMKDKLRNRENREDVSLDVNLVGKKRLAERDLTRTQQHRFQRSGGVDHQRAVGMVVRGRIPAPAIPQPNAEWRAVIAFENRIEQTGSFTRNRRKHLAHRNLLWRESLAREPDNPISNGNDSSAQGNAVLCPGRHYSDVVKARSRAGIPYARPLAVNPNSRSPRPLCGRKRR